MKPRWLFIISIDFSSGMYSFISLQHRGHHGLSLASAVRNHEDSLRNEREADERVCMRVSHDSGIPQLLTCTG